MKKSKVVLGGVLGGCAALALAPTAHAGGLFVPGTGPQAGGRAGAFVAKADDPSALYHNPAGFARQNGWVIQIGANFVDYDITFTRAGNYETPPFDGDPYQPISDQSKPELGIGPFQAVPIIAVSGDIGVKNLRIGFGLVAPQAYPTRDFAPDYEFEDPNTPPPPQRYDSMYQNAATALPSVAVAYRVLENLDVGVRGTWGFGQVQASTYVWGIRNYEEDVSNDGLFSIDVKDNFVPGFGLGVQYRPSASLEIGAAYSSKLTVDAKGSGSSQIGSSLGLPGMPEFVVPPDDQFAQCAPGGVDQNNLKACLTLHLPQTATIGARWILRDGEREKGDVELDVRWEDWSAASDVRVMVDGQSGLTGLPLNEAFIRHGFQDSFSVRLGGAYEVMSPLTLRGGVAYDTAAAPESWSRVDIDGAARATFTVGGSYTVGKIRVDVGGGYVLQPTRTVAECNPSVGNEGCPPGSGQDPVAERDQPDPNQPLTGPNNSVESPFNGGTYESHYLLFSLGLTYFL
ncbi:MAG TPA: outer membrane protein transport protein [Kofleriaceae bacterium]|nr:outer membrane protein transport protein [Kofleriaceae bacterium]